MVFKSSTNAMSAFWIFIFATIHATFITILHDFPDSYNSHIPIATKFFNKHGSTWSTF